MLRKAHDVCVRRAGTTSHHDVGSLLARLVFIVGALHPHAALVGAALFGVHGELERRTDIPCDLLVGLGRVRHHDDGAVDQLEHGRVGLRLDEGVEGIDGDGGGVAERGGHEGRISMARCIVIDGVGDGVGRWSWD